MKITFKNVGQGDSIILEWIKNGKHRIGIVDCNLYQKTNPTIQHLQSEGYSKIDFIILSHPHADHFSGLLQLLEFCEAQNILINTFAHTAISHPYYLNYLKINSDDQILLQKLFHKANALREKGLINQNGTIFQNTTISINHNFILKALSPSNYELEKFIKEIDFNNIKDYSKCHKAANYLSTVLKIYNNEKFCLLTADTEIDTFRRLKERHSDEFEELINIAQIPHHGSKSNHYPLFWSNFKQTSNCIAAVSVGTGQYGHPNDEVISDFSSWGYDIYSTNRGIVFSKSASKISLLLDAISEVVETISDKKDIIFEIK